jgi:hypothetical protein
MKRHQKAVPGKSLGFLRTWQAKTRTQIHADKTGIKRIHADQMPTQVSFGG